MKEIRTRIAPSPTGMMHLGTARTAIYCWAYARHFIGGKFLLRIEDTDQARSTKEAVQVILDGMKWLGLDYDEGPIFQMDRLERYREVVDQMLKDGLAYKCYATPEELEELRKQQMARKEKPRYDGRWRPENSVGRPIPEGVTPVIRFRNPDAGTVSWNDLVFGPISFNNEELDDLIIMRNGIPTYNFAVVIDDSDMKVSHVVRGADHINNTPRQINLYKALGLEVPEFAHLPLINGPDGIKLSKRNGDASVMDYEVKGYLPEALVNYLARLGWGHGNDEKFTKEQLAQWFELSHCSKSPARLDPKKLNHLNHLYIQEADNDRLARLTKPRIEARGGDVDGSELSLAAVIDMVKNHPETLEALADACLVFFKPWTLNEELVRTSLSNEVSRKAAQSFLEKAKVSEKWDAASIYGMLKEVMEEFQIKMGPLAGPLRSAVLGQKVSPQLDRMLEVFGKQTVIDRLEKALAL